jgi:hypothetical protein
MASSSLSPGDLLASVGLVGLACFVLCYDYERSFFATFGLSPDDVGQGYPVILGKAATGAAVYLALAAPIASGPWLIRWLGGRLHIQHRFLKLALAPMASATVTAVFLAAISFAGGLPPWPGAAVGAVLGLTTTTWTATVVAVPVEASAVGVRRLSRIRRYAAPGVALFAVLVVGAAHAGTQDSQRLLRLPRASPYASHWQELLAMNTPAVTVTWTVPGEAGQKRAAARLIGSVDQVIITFDLDACMLRRLPSGNVMTASRIAGASIDASSTDRAGSALPRCPR